MTHPVNHFHEILEQDARSVFLNTDEFAEEMTINGEVMPALWDASHQALGESSQTDPTGWGVVSVTSVLFVASADMDCPLPDEEITVNGVRYTVVKADPQMGILRLELERKTA